MKIHTRMVLDTKPEIRKMVDEMKQDSGLTMKEILEQAIQREYERWLQKNKNQQVV